MQFLQSTLALLAYFVQWTAALLGFFNIRRKHSLKDSVPSNRQESVTSQIILDI